MKTLLIAIKILSLSTSMYTQRSHKKLHFLSAKYIFKLRSTLRINSRELQIRHSHVEDSHSVVVQSLKLVISSKHVLLVMILHLFPLL